MPKWSKRATKFTVKVVYDKLGRAKITVPAPLIQGYDRPDTVTFTMVNGEIIALFARNKPAVS